MKVRSKTVVMPCVVALGFALGCSTSFPARKPPETGFLTDYSQLVKGSKTQAELVYVAPDVDWAKYDKILLDPVIIYRGTEARSRGLEEAQAQELANYFFQLIYNEFSKEWTMVQKPGPGTLRFQVALTKLDEKHVVGDVVSTVVPQVRALGRLQELVSGRFVFTGAAAVEARITDASNGQILVEGVDERIGGKALTKNYLERWSDVENIMQYWVARGVHNLCDAQSRPDCPPMPSKL